MPEKPPPEKPLLFPIDDDSGPLRSLFSEDHIKIITKDPIGHRNRASEALDDLWKKCEQKTGNNKAPENTQAEPAEPAEEE